MNNLEDLIAVNHDIMISELKRSRTTCRKNIRDYYKRNLDDTNAKSLEIKGLYHIKSTVETTLTNLGVKVV